MLLVSKILEYNFEYERYFKNVRKLIKLIQRYQIFDYTGKCEYETKKARKVLL